METRYIVTLRNNSDARAMDGETFFRGYALAQRAKHSGGKRVVMVVDDAASFEALLDAEPMVVEYAAR
jgi:hypothetical protein